MQPYRQENDPSTEQTVPLCSKLWNPLFPSSLRSPPHASLVLLVSPFPLPDDDRAVFVCNFLLIFSRFVIVNIFLLEFSSCHTTDASPVPTSNYINHYLNIPPSADKDLHINFESFRLTYFVSINFVSTTPTLHVCPSALKFAHNVLTESRG